MKALKHLEHYTNPLHVFCRLRDLGLPAGIALTIAPFIFPAISLFLAACVVGTILH